MNHIQNHNLCQSTTLNKTVAGLTGFIAITSIAVCIIGLITTQGPFNAISQLGLGNIGILLGTSIFLFILDLVWIRAIRRNSNKPIVDPLKLSEAEKNPIEITNSNNLSVKNRSEDKMQLVLETLTDFSIPPSVVNKIALPYLDFDAADLIQLAKANNPLAKDLIKDLEPFLSKITIIDESFWKREEFADLRLTFTDVPAISVEDLKNVASKLIPEVEGNAGITLLTIPKGLTFNKLVTLAEKLTKKHGEIFSYINEEFRGKHGDEIIDETYRVVLTNNVLKGTRNLSVQAQRDHANTLGVGCTLPKVIEMATLLIATLLNSNTRLLNDNPWTYSRCEENIGGWQMIVGGFVASGFDVRSYYFDPEHRGLAGRRKFTVIGT